MKKIYTLRSFLACLILLIAMSALVAGLKEGVSDVGDALFFPVAAFAVILSYVLGFSIWSTRRVWLIVLITGFVFAFIESARLMEPIKLVLQSIPQFQVELIRSVLEKEAPDIAIFQTQFTTIITTAGTFTSRVLSASVDQPSVREFLWDIPLLILAAWAGWETGRRNQTLLALAPSLGFHAFILTYTGKDTFSLQIAVFALIFLMGINQKWNNSQEKKDDSDNAARETYPAIILLSIGLAIAAGFAPSISFKEVAQKLRSKDEFAKAIGLEREMAQANAASGLPRQHLIGISPTLFKTVVFTVKTGEMDPSERVIIKETVPRHYWRWLTYDIYDGHGWTTSPTESVSYSANEFLLPIPANHYRVIHQQVTKAFTQDGRLFWTGSLAGASQPFNASWRIPPGSLSSSDDPLLNADMLGAGTQMQIYEADSLLHMVSANQLRASSQIYPQEIRLRYLALPETVPQRVRDLAEELTANFANPYDKTKAIEAYLRDYPYSLDVAAPPPDRDIADYFLFDLKTGYCDYYATSMIVLARAVGLPARMVLGYASGSYDSFNAVYVVREADAHSWVEVYFTGAGWIEFEPTASQLQITLPNELAGENASSDYGAIIDTKKDFLPQSARLPLGIGMASIIILFSISWFFRTQGLLKSHKTIGSIYEYIYYHGKKIYKDAPLHETPSVFAAKLRGRLKTGKPWLLPAPGEIRLLTDLYLQETYSAHPITAHEHAIAEKVWKRLFWRLLYARFILARSDGAKPPIGPAKTPSHMD